MGQKTIQELNMLSQEVYGSKSKWRKLMDKGERTLITEEVTEYVPDSKNPDGEGTTKKTQVPLKKICDRGMDMYQSIMVHYDLAGIKAKMLELKDQQAQFRKMIEDMEKEKLMNEAKAEVTKASGSSKIT